MRCGDSALTHTYWIKFNNYDCVITYTMERIVDQNSIKIGLAILITEATENYAKTIFCRIFSKILILNEKHLEIYYDF